MSDLIDRDALRDEVLNDNTFDNDTVNYYLATIDGAPTIDATPVDLALNVIIRYAIRYAYGRGDPAPTAVMVEYVRPLVPKLSSETLVVIERDLHCAATGVGGPKIDRARWLRLYDAVVEELERRGAI